jgi:hypothetical protein
MTNNPSTAIGRVRLVVAVCGHFMGGLSSRAVVEQFILARRVCTGDKKRVFILKKASGEFEQIFEF